MMHRLRKAASVVVVAGCLLAVASCKNSSATNTPVQDRERIEASGRAAAAITASLTRELKGAYAGKTPPSISVHVGDITLIGFDEAIDAEEWGMRETNIETGAAPSGTLTPEKAAMLNNSQDPNENKRVSRKVDLKKGGMVIVLNEDSVPVITGGQAAPVAQPKPAASTKP